MLHHILDPEQERLLRSERQLLTEIETALAGSELVSDEQRRNLRDSVAQLDELFMLVVVGEFNAGKSALVNALLGHGILAEGVTPTTHKIHRLGHGDELRRVPESDGLDLVYAPVDILRQLLIVDTPGTNAIDRRHEAITSEFVPRSDLVVFITSADRPFSESERSFLEGIRNWGKKVMVVINKVDILPGANELAEVREYVATHAKALLGVDPPIFAVSARDAVRARAAGDDEALRASGLPAIAEALENSLDDAERVRLKLSNPVGVASHILHSAEAAVDARFELLADDLATIEDIEGQLSAYENDVDREFELRLADMDNTLHRLEQRGNDYFDDTLRLGRIGTLLNKEAVRRDFERTVVANAPQEIDAKTESLVDWVVESDLNQWHAVVEHVNRRRVHHAERIVGDVGGRFELDRRGLLDTVGRAARDGMASYDRDAEARRLAEDVQKAVAGTAVVEVGAVGLGATVAYLAGSTAADATGLIAAGLLAALGLFILPDRRRRAKKQLRTKVAELRSEIMSSVREQFHRASSRSRSKIRQTIAPYTRFVSAEKHKLEGIRNELQTLSGELYALQRRIESMGKETDGES